MKAERIGGKILAVTIVVCSLWTGTATGEMNMYTFDPNQSTVVRSFFTSDTYTLTGEFQLTVDANTGSFDRVDATFSDDPNLQTGDLRELFYMDELVGDVVNDTTIEFELPPGHPVLQSYDIHITVTLQNDQVHLAGYRNPLMVGEPGYTLDAVAYVVTVFYVDAVNGDDNNDGLSPETAFATIQKGIDSAQNRDLVIVLPGTYTGSGNRDIDFKGKAITVRSKNGPNTCIVDCEARGQGFYFHTGENDDSVLEGLTIINGGVWSMGAGIFCAGTSPSIRNCIIRNCTILGTGAGGGIYCDGGGPAIINCTIIDNTALEGGGIYLLNCKAMINSCTISRNGNYYSLGGGIYCRDSSPNITDCTITENDGDNGGGGMYFKNSSSTITDCTITENYGGNGGGGMYCEYGSLSITDCNFVRNEADYGGGGGIMCTDSNTAISRCTFSENGTDADYSDGGGAIYLVRTGGTIADCSFIDNETIGGSGAGIWCDDQSSPVISDCSFVSHRDNVVTCSDGSDPIIRNCSFTANWGTPIDISGSTPTVSHCEVVGNYMMGFEIGGVCSPMIVNCRITGNDWGGIWIGGGSPTIVNCTIADNLKYAGIYCQGGHVSVHNSILWKNRLLTGEPNSILLEDGATVAMTYSDVQGGWPGEGNIDVDPQFISPGSGDYHLFPASPCIDTGENSALPSYVVKDLDGNPRILNGTIDMGAYEFQGIQILYVDDDAAQFGNGTSWATAFKYLQDALFNAIPPAEIRVAQGTYKPDQGAGINPGDRTATFQLINGVSLKGGFAGAGSPDPNARDIELYETILSGDMNGDDEPNFVNNDDNSYHVVTGSGTNATAVLDGLTIEAGNANGGSGDQDRGGGIYIENGSPTIMDCTLSNNKHGGMANYNSSPKIIDCTFNNNSARDGGGMYNNESSPTVISCKFRNNSAQGGGGMSNWYCDDLMVIDCTFSGNFVGIDCYAGGMSNSYSHPTLINCTFIGNSTDKASDGGAMVNWHSNPNLTNCTFAGNSAERAGGMYNRYSNPALANCTFSSNYAEISSGGMYNLESNPTLVDCIFTYNEAGFRGGGMYNYGSSPILSNCTFSGNESGDEGGGMYNSESELECNPELTNCKFAGNRSYSVGGGMFNEDSAPKLINCLFSGNSALRGGGMFNSDGAPKLTNCIFTGNYANLHTGNGIYSVFSKAIITNCILWGDILQDVCVTGYTVLITYSNIQGGWPGEGNIDADPCFLDPGYWADTNDPNIIVEPNDPSAIWVDGDYHLSLDSPCIDTGDPGYIAGPNETDLDGNPRVIGGRIDMGAYEFFGPVYIDDDAPNDPGPGDPQVSDPLENGTEAHPFDTIQEAVNVALEGYTVLVRQGSYSEPGTGNCIDFLGKNITLASIEPTDWGIVDSTIIRGYVQFSGTESPNCKFTGFKVSNLEGAIYGNHTHATISHCNISGNGPCGATVIKDCDGTISNCLITDNTTFFQCGVFPVVFGCNGVIKNCTIASNTSGVSVGSATIKNCIIYNNSGSQLGVGDSETLNISYCNLQGGLEGITGGGIVNWGPGNIETDPCFVRLGYWIMDEITLVEGDYHLRSEGWRWNTDSNSWTYDFVTSRCVDAGNPGSPLRGELMSVPRDPDNVWGINLRINMGAYGGTSQASMPPYGWVLPADLNNDGTTNFVDFAYQAQDWQMTASEQPGDQNRDGVVNKMDLARLAEDWLKITTFFIPELVIPTGSLRVVILPTAVIDAGAQWRVDSGTWHDSTYTKTGLSAGPHTLEYKHIIGWITPPTETVQIELSQTTTRVGTYVPYAPDLPPAPVPAIISIQAVSPNSISMTSSEAFDESGVQYYFEATTPGGHDSGWQDEPNYTDVNLIPDTTYCYRVKARDKSANHNETIWSPQVCTATPPPPDTLPPLPDPMQWDPVVDANGYDGRPLEVLLAPFGPTDYGATMRAIDADDVAPPGMLPNEVEYYFQCQDDSGFDSGWRTVAAYPNEDERRTYTVKIGPSELAYRFRVKTRDASDNLNETDWSDWYPAVYRDPP